MTDFNDPATAAKDLMKFIHNADMTFYKKNNRQVAVGNVSWEIRMKEWLKFISSLSEAGNNKYNNGDHCSNKK